jgi:membrane protein
MAAPPTTTQSHKSPLGLAPWLVVALLLAAWPRAARRVATSSEAELDAPIEAAADGRGRDAKSPLGFNRRGWLDIVWRTGEQFNEDRLPAVAGGVAFYVLLAIFPALAAFVSLYGLVADIGEAQRQLTRLAVFLPREVMIVLSDQMMTLAAAKPAGLTIGLMFGLGLSIWSASAGAGALMDGLNIAYGEVEKRSYWRRALLALGSTVGALLMLLVMGVAIAASSPLLARLGVAGPSAPVVFMGRWVSVLILTVMAISVTYRYGPSRAHARWRWVNWGAVLAAALWVAGSLGFSWYVNNIGHYATTYGALGAAIGLMMWIWFSMLVILIGAEFNAEMEHQTAVDSTTGPAAPIGQRGARMADSLGARKGRGRAKAATTP